MNGLFCVLLLSFLGGVFGVETDEMKSAAEGDSITLDTALTEILEDDTLLWMFGDEEAFIAQITRKAKLISLDVSDNERIKHRLQLDHQTGSLTIRNIRTTDSGLYKLKIISKDTKYKRFHVLVDVVPGAEANEMKMVSVMEGESVTLNTTTDIQRDDLLVWRFGAEGILIAKCDRENNKTSFYDVKGKFRDRLQLNDQTGSLTITNIRTTDTGLYKLQIKGSEGSLKRFSVFVRAVPDAGLSPGVVSGLIVLLLAPAVVMCYCYTLAELTKTMTLSVMEGNSAVLQIETEIDKIDWWFGKSHIAAVRNNKSIYDDDERFKGRQQMDTKTGSLTIRKTKRIHSGCYKAKITTTAGISYRLLYYVGVCEDRMKVFATDEDPVTLPNETTIQTDDETFWRFGNTCVARNNEICDERFRDRLQLDRQTGSLTITNIRTTDSGLYELMIINSTGISYKKFDITVYEKKIIFGEGDSVTLQTDLCDIQRDDVILWRFGPQDILIAKISGVDKTPSFYQGADGRFRDRLQQDRQTGSLTITNIKASDAGLYDVVLINRDVPPKIFSLALSAE